MADRIERINELRRVMEYAHEAHNNGDVSVLCVDELVSLLDEVIAEKDEQIQKLLMLVHTSNDALINHAIRTMEVSTQFQPDGL